MAKKGSEARMEQEKLIADLEKQIEATKTSRDDKLVQSLAHLRGQLAMAKEKYLTVNGYMQVRQTIEQAAFGDKEGADDFDGLACMVAVEMSELAGKLAESLESVDVMTVDDSILDGLLDADFVSGEITLLGVVRQLLIVNLLQNVGPALDDLVQFREGANGAIASLEAELAKHGVMPGQLTVHDGGVN